MSSVWPRLRREFSLNGRRRRRYSLWANPASPTMNLRLRYWRQPVITETFSFSSTVGYCGGGPEMWLHPSAVRWRANWVLRFRRLWLLPFTAWSTAWLWLTREGKLRPPCGPQAGKRGCQMVDWMLRGLVAAIFLRAGVGKLLGREDFYWQLRASATLPRWLEMPVSYAVPAFEVAAGLGLAFPMFGGEWAPPLAAIMLCAFAGYAVWIAATGRHVRCWHCCWCWGRVSMPTEVFSNWPPSGTHCGKYRTTAFLLVG